MNDCNNTAMALKMPTDPQANRLSLYNALRYLRAQQDSNL